MNLLNILKKFSKREYIVLITAISVAIISGTFTAIHVIENITIKNPSYGGSFSEGVIGQPSFINPVLAKNGTIDQDLVSIIFASVTELSSSIKHNDDYTVWNIRIKDGSTWENKDPITSDDIIFTIEQIQNPQMLSPLFQEWQNINVSRVSEREIKFELSNPYSLFKENILSHLRPIPKKNFANLSPASFRLSIYNIEPIGSGPYKYSSLIKKSDGFIESYKLVSNKLFDKIGHSPYIDTYTMNFYKTKKDIISAYNSGAINGFFTDDYSILKSIIPSSKKIDIQTTKYIAMFMNSSANKYLKDINIRNAISTAINRESIISDVYKKEATITNGPIPITFNTYNNKLENIIKYDPKKSRELILESGWEYNEDKNEFFRDTKNGQEILTIKITVPDIPKLKAIATIISDNLKNVGILSNVRVVDVASIENQVLKTRDYEALIFGNVLSSFTDLYSFWYSSEKFYPGLNLSLYQNSSVDELITDMRKRDVNSEQRIEDIFKIQELITKDFPAVFLLSPMETYVIRNNIPGISVGRITFPSDRLGNIENWYIKTKISIR